MKIQVFKPRDACVNLQLTKNEAEWLLVIVSDYRKIRARESIHYKEYTISVFEKKFGDAILQLASDEIIEINEIID